jgi:cytochrome c oxidase subunit 3
MTEAANIALAYEHKDYTGAKIGMWLFLFTEMILFGVLFLLYAVYHTEYSQEFHKAAKNLSKPLGTLNTLIL